MEKDTQTKLLDAAIQLFAQKGFAAVSIRELAEAANVNIAAISYHFGGKEGLYQAVLEEQFGVIAGVLKKVESVSQLTGSERLSLYARQIAAVHSQRPLLTRFMQSELVNPTPCFESVVKKHIVLAYRFLVTALRDGIAAGQFKAGLNAEYAALSLAGIMNFYFLANPIFREFMPLSPDSPQEYTTQAFEIYLDGIRRKENE